MSATPPVITDAALTDAYLGNVADAIRGVLMPALSGSARSRADECAVILARLRLSLSTPAATSPADAPLSLAADWLALAKSDGGRLDAAEARAAAAAGSAAEAKADASRTFDPLKFERYLQQHTLGGPALKLSESRQLAGGRSKQTILVTIEGAAALPNQIVVRQDWASAVTGTSVVSEFALLKRVFEAGLRVPQPLLLEASAEVLGGAFLVVTRMPGGPEGDIFNPPSSEVLALQVAEQLARLHQLPTADFTALGVSTEASSDDQLRTGLAGFRAMNAQLGPASPTIEVALSWLDAHVGDVKPQLALVHNDLGCHNFLIEGETLTAILDWELAHIGHPAADLGYIRSWITKMTSWPHFVAAYEAAGGPVIDSATVDFYTLWCGVRLYCLLMQARAGVAMGMVKDTEITYAVAQFVPMLLHRISIELRAILEQP